MILSVFVLIFIPLPQTYCSVNTRQFVFVSYQSWTDGQVFALNSTEQFACENIIECTKRCTKTPGCVSVSNPSSNEKSCNMFLKSYKTRQLGQTKRNMELWIRQQPILPKYMLEKIPGRKFKTLCMDDEVETYSEMLDCPHKTKIHIYEFLAWRNKWNTCSENRNPCLEQFHIFNHCNKKRFCNVTFSSLFLQSCQAYASAMSLEYTCYRDIKAVKIDKFTVQNINKNSTISNIIFMKRRNLKALVLLDTANKQLLSHKLGGPVSSKVIYISGDPQNAVNIFGHTVWIIHKGDLNNKIVVYATFPTLYYLYSKNLTDGYDRITMINSSTMIATMCTTNSTPVLIDVLRKDWTFIRSLIPSEDQSKRFGCPSSTSFTTSGEFRVVIGDAVTRRVVCLRINGDHLWSYLRDNDPPIVLAVNSKSQVFVSYTYTPEIILLSERGKFLQLVFATMQGMPIQMFCFGKTDNEMYVIRESSAVYKYKLI